ncbi:MAG: hypothetical protein ACOH2J_16705 [Allorhizobium sp.]
MTSAQTPASTGFDAPFGATEFSFAARLAIGHLKNRRLSQDLDPNGKCAPFLTHPAFRAALAALSEQPLKLCADDISQLASHQEGRLALLIASEPDKDVTAAARLLATAILHKQVVRLGLKTERQHAQAVLGQDGFRFATQEAPTLHAALSSLDNDPSVWRSITAGDPPTASAILEQFGHSVLNAFVAAVAPGLVACLPGLAKTPLPLMRVPDIVKLMRRRNPKWAPIIV